MPEWNILQSHDLRLPRELIPEVQYEDERDIEVSGDERLGVPLAMDENGVAGGEEDDDKGDAACPCGVWLEGSFPGELVAANALFLQAIVEAKVDEADDNPLDEGSGGDKILEP